MLLRLGPGGFGGGLRILLRPRLPAKLTQRGRAGGGVSIDKYVDVGVIRTTSAQLKKRPFKKKKIAREGEDGTGFKISAFATAEEFNLEDLIDGLDQSFSYKLSELNKEFDSENVVHIVQSANQIEGEAKDLFIFREGSVVLWNFEDAETTSILTFLRRFQKNSFSEEIVSNEQETMCYIRSPESMEAALKGNQVILPTGKDEGLEKFAISNAMALSVHLGAYESVLDDYIDSMAQVTEDLKSGRQINMSQEEVLKKMGQLFALRHVINLSSDLLDTPDFYWDREELEKLYQTTFSYFWISKRTKVINEKINHCIELVELLSTQLSDRHHIRLEWMIIILIMVEVGFEFLHYVDKYLSIEDANVLQ